MGSEMLDFGRFLLATSTTLKCYVCCEQNPWEMFATLESLLTYVARITIKS